MLTVLVTYIQKTHRAQSRPQRFIDTDSSPYERVQQQLSSEEEENEKRMPHLVETPFID